MDTVIITKVESNKFSPGVQLNKEHVATYVSIHYGCILATSEEGVHLRTSIIKKIEVVEDYQMHLHTTNSIYLLSFLARASSDLFKKISQHSLAEFKFM